MRPYNLECLSDPDAETGERLQFVTNYFVLPALTIALIDRQHWRVGLFFTWKQHLRIKAFCGTSENAVKTQIWIACRRTSG